jgi:hypothetical protein
MTTINWSELEDSAGAEKGCSRRAMKGRTTRKQRKDQKAIAKGIRAVRHAYDNNPGASEQVVREQAHKFLSGGVLLMFLQFLIPILAKWAIDWAINRMNLPKGGGGGDRTYGAPV